MYDQALQETFQTVRIPLYGGESTSSNYSGNPTATDGTFINMVPKTVTNVVTGNNDLILEKRNGHVNQMNVLTLSGLAGTMTTKDFICISALSDVFVGAFLRNNAGTRTIEIIQIRPGANTVAVIGSIATVAGPPAVNVSTNTVVHLSEIKQGLIPGVAVVITDPEEGAGTSAAYYSVSSSGVFGAASLTKIADADFPTNQTPYVHIVGPLVQFNQISYVLGRNGNIYNSNDDDIGTWSALGFLEAQSYADRGVGLIRYKHHIVAFGDTTVEFFNDVGNDPTLGSPLERTEQAFIKFGAVYSKSILNIDDTLYWISNSNPVTTGLWKLEGYAPVKISTTRIDEVLSSTNATKASWNLQTCYYAGCKSLMLSPRVGTQTSYMFGATITYLTNEPQITANDITAATHCMNLQNNIWWIYNSDEYFPLGGTLYYASPVSAINSSTVGTQYMLQDAATDSADSVTVMAIAPGARTEDYSAVSAADAEFLAAYELPVVWFGTEKRKFLHKYKVGIDVGLQTSDDSIPNRVRLITTKNDYQTFQVRASPVLSETVPLRRLYWNNFGEFRRLRSLVFYKGDSRFVTRFVEWDVSQGVF